MGIAGSTIYHHDKRRFARVRFERTIKLYADDSTGRQYNAKNLSLGGMFLEGGEEYAVGQDCRIELHETGHRSSMIYKICGKIVHTESRGMGIEFTGMEDHSLMYLQTMVLYSSDDPVAAAENFDDVMAQTGSSSTC
ncbi:PilZ domain-containing protein [Desulfobulbus rhabdoformis]|uniref:PilZ domain-containing protein n=1 Tax=Desulfobulbus rhabdoformis TaxID=34032 RepID=UPI001965201B|nr:PilZ domain-containing protein [Desulfobulbus rhabdoformis]MBM9614463.1 PilZ domain-containing protein [Desulfobulbus rhabdoformis]